MGMMGQFFKLGITLQAITPPETQSKAWQRSLLTILFSSLGGLGLGSLSLILSPSGVAQTVIPRSMESPMTLFRKVTLAPGFENDPFYLAGISGGTESAEAIAGRLETETGLCTGYVSSRPDYEMVLQDDFSYLHLNVRSVQDTVLIVAGPGGTWCSDDVYHQNPSIAGQWLPGLYKIWVGSAEMEQYSPYQLEITEIR